MEKPISSIAQNAPAEKTYRTRGWLLTIFGALLTSFGLLCTLIGLVFLVDPSGVDDLPSTLLGIIILSTPSIMIGIPMFALGIWLLGRKVKSYSLSKPGSLAPDSAGLLGAQSADSGVDKSKRWGWALGIIGWLGIVWSISWLIWFMLNMLLSFEERQAQMIGSAIFCIPGLIIGLPMFIIGIWLIARKTGTATSTPVELNKLSL